MHFLRRIGLLGFWFGCVLLLVTIGAPGGAQPGDPKTAQPEPKPKKIALDKLKLPPGTIIVLAEKDLSDISGLSPHTVLLTPEKYKEKEDLIAQLQKQLKGDRKGPYACKMNAAVEGDAVRVVADLYFQTDQPRSTVPIGFRGTQLNDAKLRLQGSDGSWQMAAVDVTVDGYVVQVEKPGDYQLQVVVRLPVAPSGGAVGPGAERGFDLALPGAAVTTLTLELPDSVRELRWNKNTQVLLPEQKRWEIALGKITQLQVVWKDPVPSKLAGPLREARGQVIVRVEETQVVTTAELTLTVKAGKAANWKLWLPPQAEVKVLAPEKLVGKAPNKIGNQCWSLTLAAPVAEPIKLQVTVVTARPAAKYGIGPFAVDGALRQEGTIEVKVPDSAIRPRLRLTFHKIVPNLLEEFDPPGSDVVAYFKYWDMRAPPKNSPAGTAVAAPLEFELKAVQGKVETRVEYTLRLLPGELNPLIEARCKIVATPLDASSVGFLDIQLPRIPLEGYALLLDPASGFPVNVPWASWVLASQLPQAGEWRLDKESAPAELSYPEASAKDQRKVRVRLKDAQKKEFIITLVGTYTLPSGASKVRLELPRPLAIHDKGAKGHIEVVGDGLELLVQNGGPELPAPEKHQYTRTWDRSPQTWDLAWRPYRPVFAVTAVADITFRPKHAHVRQQLTWDALDRPLSGPGKMAWLRLRVAPEVKGFKLISGGKLVPAERDKKQSWVDVYVETVGKGVLLLEYDFALPAKRDPFRVPLVGLEQATQVETKVRLWSQPGTIVSLAEPSLAELAWKDIGTEVVAGRADLPVRVLQTEDVQAPLFLRAEAASASLASIVADRVLIQVVVDEAGIEMYRARFLLTNINTTHVDVAMPVPLGQLAPQFLLDGKVLTPQPRDSAGLVARLDVEPSLYGKPVVLEVLYQLKRGEPSPEGLWHTTLNPPVLESNVVLGKVRWQVSLPPGLLAVSARGDASTEQQWQWRYGLPSLEPASTTAELEHWLSGQETTEALGEASLVSGCGNLEILRIFRVSRAVWFLLCSGVLLLIALALYLLPPAPVGWLGLAVLALGSILAGAWLWPELLRAILYGALPGGLLLAGLLAIQWTLHQRYRRQLLFMPGFTRVKAGSSLVRASSVQRNREPSTIDAPLPPEKSNPGSP